MGALTRFVGLAAGILAIPPLVFCVAGLTAPERIVSQREIVIGAPPDKVFGVATDWHLLKAEMGHMLPEMGPRTVVGGGEPSVGRIFRYKLGDGRNWDQRITAWEPNRKYAFENDTKGDNNVLGRVKMTLDFEPVAAGQTRVRFASEVKSEGFINRAATQVFGNFMGTLKGYQTAILEAVKRRVEGPAKPAAT